MNGRRLDWDKAKSVRLGAGPSEPADPDMSSEPEHQAWWRGKTREQRAASKEALQKQMADAFGRGGPVVVPRAKEVISPKIKALLAELASKERRRKVRFDQALRHAKARAKPAKPRG